MANRPRSKNNAIMSPAIVSTQFESLLAAATDDGISLLE